MEFGIKGVEYNFFGHSIMITQTNIVSWIIMAILILFAVAVRIALKNFKDVPESKFQNFVEAFVEFFDNFVTGVMGQRNKAFVPYFMAVFTFLAIGNMIALFGIRPPTADINATLAFGIVTFFLIHITGMRVHGLGHFKEFIEPSPIMLPIHIVGELATPISLSFRLFGNILAGLILVELFYHLMPIFLKVGIPVFLHAYFDVFEGILQGFIFTMLSMVYISTKSQPSHH